MRNVIILIVLALVGLFVLVSGYLYLSQDRMIFMPTSEMAITPDDIGMTYENVEIEIEPGLAVNGWFFPSPDSGKTVLMCHGNAGNISHRLETVRFLQELGAGILLFDYRGYGKSPGKPSEEGMYADAAAAYRWLRENRGLAAQDIILLGRSLGGAVAVELATHVDCGGLVVESSFSSAPELGQIMFPFVPIKWLLRYRFDSVSRIGNVRCPVLVTHSPDDEMIPFAMGQRLFEAAPEPKRFVTLHGDHNELEYFDSEQYIEMWQQVAAGSLEK